MWAGTLLRDQGRRMTAVMALLTVCPLVLANADDKTTAGRGNPESRTMLIEPSELQKNLTQPGWRILDTRPQAEYGKGHIPGAVWVDVKSWQELGKKERGFHDTRAWGEKVGQLGI